MTHFREAGDEKTATHFREVGHVTRRQRHTSGRLVTVTHFREAGDSDTLQGGW